MSRRIDIELTSAREDGSWTWRAAGAREPKGTLDGGILPPGATSGQVLRVEVEGHLDGIEIVNVLPPRSPRSQPERLELKSTSADQPLVTSALAPKRSGERGRRRNDGGRDERGRDGTTRTRERRGDRGERGERGRDRQDRHHERETRPAPPPVEQKPKAKRLRPGKVHRSALLEAVPAEQRPIAEQLVAGGLPAVRQAIEKQNAELKAEGKPEVKPDALLRVAEDLRPKAAAANWRDRAEAAVSVVDELDLRDLRSVVNAAGDAGRDDEAKALAAQLREALANRVEKEHSAWLAELADTVRAGRVVRALRLSSRPPKAGAPIPGDVATQLAEATAASLTSETGPDRWATVLDALAYSPVRRRVIPQSLPEKLTPDLRATIGRLASRLPEIAHIFDIEPDPAAERAARNRRRPTGGRSGPGDRPKGGKGGDRGRSKGGKGDRRPKGAPTEATSGSEAVDSTTPTDQAAAAAPTEATSGTEAVDSTTPTDQAAAAAPTEATSGTEAVDSTTPTDQETAAAPTEATSGTEAVDSTTPTDQEAAAAPTEADAPVAPSADGPAAEPATAPADDEVTTSEPVAEPAAAAPAATDTAPEAPVADEPPVADVAAPAADARPTEQSVDTPASDASGEAPVAERAPAEAPVPAPDAPTDADAQTDATSS